MNKKDLSQLYWLNREVEEQQRRLNELECLTTNCTSHITGLPRGNSMLDKLGGYAAEIADLRGLVDLNLKKCFYELNRLNRYINAVEDSQMRMILSLRYINGLTWQQIAVSIGEHDEQYPRRKHNAFLKNHKPDEIDERSVL
ncbi:hypothetical protein FACS1894202_12880 [Clostridia bacterium]|nr:hypothetical protein FACS1894202_12880 [Clostridia bacterium]